MPSSSVSSTTVHLADTFRAHLELAGVDRSDLFETSTVRRHVRFHDLRATFVTVALAAGRTEAWVTARTGHRSSGQVATYRRLAQMHADVGAAWFSDMAATIPELAIWGKGRGKHSNRHPVRPFVALAGLSGSPRFAGVFVLSARGGT